MLIRRRRWPLMAMIGLLTLPGCQVAEKWGLAGRFADKPAARPSPPTEDVEQSAPLKPAQKAEIQVALGRVMETRGDDKGAEQAYLVALQHDPQRVEAYSRLAVLHSQQGNFTAANEWFQKALQQQPRNPEIHCDLGYCLYTQSRWPEAEQSFRQATALDPQHRRAHNNLGLLLVRTNRVQESLNEFAAAGCSAPEAYENVAFALTLEQRWPEAHQFCQAALAQNPKSKTAQKLNATLVARLNPGPGASPTAGREPIMAGSRNRQYEAVQPAAYYPAAR